jgi:hypothetical protein
MIRPPLDGQGPRSALAQIDAVLRDEIDELTNHFGCSTNVRSLAVIPGAHPSRQQPTWMREPGIQSRSVGRNRLIAPFRCLLDDRSVESRPDGAMRCNYCALRATDPAQD